LKAIILLLSLTLLIQANDRALLFQKMKQEHRVALVVGNNNYQSLSKLKNPINDARSMKSVLQERGFEVIYKEDATKKEMKKLIDTFSNKLQNGGVGLYYFAGHGINVDGNNYLVATNSDLQSKDDVEYETYALNRITKAMQKAKNRLNIIILDACRNDPFSRSASGGLAPIGDAKGIFVAYATQAGNVALDGEDSNGIFTKHLIEQIQMPGKTIEEVFKHTREAVQHETAGKQSPGVYNQITGDFFFTFGDKSNYTQVTPLVSKKVVSKKPSHESLDDMKFWEYVKAENTVPYYKAYLKKYPHGVFADVAKEHIKELENKIIQAKLDERDSPHIGVGGGIIGAEMWVRKQHFSYGFAIQATSTLKTVESAAFVNYHLSKEKNGSYGSFAFGYHYVTTDSTEYFTPGLGLGVGYRSVFFDFIYIDYGLKGLLNKEYATVSFHTFTGFEF
jgi:uncharacterized caspase-like protein